MNCFMGYNPLATKQVKVTVWVNEQDGATPVAPSNPSEGDCFIVYATDEAMLSNDPTSKKTYTNGDWADAEGGGGLDMPTVTATGTSTYTYSCDKTYAECKEILNNSTYEAVLPSGLGSSRYPCYPAFMDFASTSTRESSVATMYDEENFITFYWAGDMWYYYLPNGTITEEDPH